MTILIRWNLLHYLEGSFEVTDRELDVMVAAGVDVRNEFEVADYYQDHLGKTVDDVQFRSIYDLADDWDGADSSNDEIIDWSPEGEAPEKYWPDEDDSDD